MSSKNEENIKKTKQNDLGADPVGRLLINLSIPAIAAQLINALYNIVDRMYIGRIEGYGSEALTGVGVTFPVIMVISAFVGLIGRGGPPHVAIKMGENKKDEAENILGNCFTSLVISSIILTIVFRIYSRDLLMLFGASNFTIGYATDYINIYILGTLFSAFSVGLNQFISSQGRAKIAMYTVLIGAILNIILDPILIFGLGMGVKGAALASVISQGVSATWVLIFLFSDRSALKIKKKYMKIKKNIIAPVITLGISPFIMTVTESMVNIALNSSLQKYGGDLAVGSLTIISSVKQFAVLPIYGFAQAAQPIISFNYGAKQMDRVRLTFSYVNKLCFLASSIAFLITMLTPHLAISLFTNDPELIESSIWAIRIFMAGFFMMGVLTSCQQTFMALGQGKTSMFMALLRKIILLIPLIYITPFFFEDKVFAVFVAEPMADITATTITFIVFKLSFDKILNKRSLEA